MRVELNRPLKPATARRGDRARTTGGVSFSEALAEEEATARAVAPASASGVASLIALQEVNDPSQGRREGFRRGERVLDRLDEIRRGLLTGSVPRQTLVELQRELKETRAATLDPGLDEILGEIELRAAVELAKLEAS